MVNNIMTRWENYRGLATLCIIAVAVVDTSRPRGSGTYHLPVDHEYVGGCDCNRKYRFRVFWVDIVRSGADGILDRWGEVSCKWLVANPLFHGSGILVRKKTREVVRSRIG